MAYARILELQIELCKSVSVLCKTGLLRPAHATLRSLLESMASLVWASENQRYMDLFNRGDQTNMKETLKRIGWSQEYDRTYKWLSAFVHAGMDEADFYRTYEPFAMDQPFPEITPDGDYYAMISEDGAMGLESQLMSPERAEGEYGLYLSTKPLDIVCTGLAQLFGFGDKLPKWWPANDLQQLEWLCKQLPNLNNQMLWPSRRSA